MSLSLSHVCAMNSDNGCSAAACTNDCGFPADGCTTDSLHVVVVCTGTSGVGIGWAEAEVTAFLGTYVMAVFCEGVCLVLVAVVEVVVVVG